MTERRKLGQILIDAGVITTDQLAEALFAQRAQPRRRRLGLVIADLGFASEEQIAAGLAAQLGLPYLELGSRSLDPSVVEVVPRRLAENHVLIVIERNGTSMTVAMADPTNVISLDDVRVVADVTELRTVVSTPKAIRAAILRSYKVQGMILEPEAHPLSTDLNALPVSANDDLETVIRQTEMAPVVRFVNTIIADAVRLGATDIHIEPQGNDCRVRARIDGMLREMIAIPRNAQASIISRIKIISGMDIAERRRPQDGRGRVVVSGVTADIRVSSIPTLSGEKLVLRLLPQEGDGQPLDGLGMDEACRNLLEQHLGMPQGLIIFTGPTGTGKTTSVYSTLRRLAGPERNITTIEDPVEYRIPWVSQIQVDEKSDVTFAKALRSILRQDPDVIFMGEIRDAETARIAMQASLTGHLVLTTLHTNDAASAVVRLMDLGIEPNLIASSLSLVVAQRLVRAVCTRCSEPTTPDERTLSLLRLGPSDGREKLRAGTGCETCSYTGYKGRTGLFEALPVTRQVRGLIAARSAAGALAGAAGLRSLRDEGIRKAIAGTTTLDEIVRITAASDFEPTDGPAQNEMVAAVSGCPTCQTGMPRVAGEPSRSLAPLTSVRLEAAAP